MAVFLSRACALVLMRFPMRFLAPFLLVFGLLWPPMMRAIPAHPMGNFSINHYARFEASASALSLRTVFDFAEVPSIERLARLDSNGDKSIGDPEKRAFLRSHVPALLRGLSVQIDGRPIPIRARKSALETRAGAGGLETLRLIIDAEWALTPRATHRINYRDSNFAERTGWKEIVAVAGQGRALRDSNASARDQSRELTIFPTDSNFVAPLQTSADFTVTASSANASGAVRTPPDEDKKASTRARGDARTPQNSFTQSIAVRELTPGLIFSGLLVALAFGAAHALSPGHGKTMVAAYLVGSRGTPRHAVLLGLVVTITHTFGVFALGLALLYASQTITPERLFPALGAVSGMLVFGVGLWLLLSRWQDFSAHSAKRAAPQHDAHSHDAHSHDAHSHDAHSHDGHGAHSHDHAPGLVHSHGGRAHSHAVPEGPITLKTLVLLGISGGIVPCPEALVVLLAAVKFGRLGFGMLLITAFSIGLAAALIAIGLLVVGARARLGRFDALGENSTLARVLPLASAAFITLLGAVLILRAAGPGAL